MTLSETVRTLIAAGKSRDEVQAELVRQYPEAHPKWLRTRITNVLYADRKNGREDVRWQPEPASSG